MALLYVLAKGNNLAFHLIQSFEPGEVDYQKAHEIGKQLADAVTKGQHEYVLTTHIDKGHVHNHIIFCAVNFVDHRKYNSNKRSYYGIRNMSDKLCRENGLSVVVPGKGSKGKSYAEYQAEKTGTSWKGKLKIAVDALIPQVSSFEELLQRLQAAGYEIKPGKYVSCRAPGQERFTRLKTLGADYTEEAIRERIAGRRAKAAKAPREQRGVSLLIDIENSIKAAQSKGYEQWAKIHNLKQAAKTMNFLTEHEVYRWMESDHAYTIRFGISMLMRYYLEDTFQMEYPDKVAQIRSEEYYVNMMRAWYFATALAKQYDKILPFIEKQKLDVWTHNKTIQKAIESYRITPEQKEYLRGLKIKK